MTEWIIKYVNFLYEIKTQPGVLLRPKHQPLCENGLLIPQIFFLSTHCLYKNVLDKVYFVLVEAHEHSITVLRRNLFPCVIRRDLILPALSSLRGLNPIHDTNFFGVWK